jgi:hypothetical protein
VADTLAPTFGETIRREWKFYALILALTAILFLTFVWREQAKSHPVEEIHTIQGFFVTADYGAGTPLVRTRDKAGRGYAARIEGQLDRNCAVGRPIRVLRNGVAIRLPPNPCPKEAVAN